MSTKQELTELLTPYGQEHLLRFWDDLDESSQQSLAEQIREIDFEQLAKLYAARDHSGGEDLSLDDAVSPSGIVMGVGNDTISADDARLAGAKALMAGDVGVVIVAGGQGTRLGFDAPKGTYPIGPLTDRTLFQIHVEKLIARARRYNTSIPLYLMTSPATHDATVEFFAANDRFGLAEEDLIIFCQGTMPAVDEDTGKVLLAAPDRIALSPDGHGGMLAAMKRWGVMDDMARRGIRHLYYLQIDNPLVEVAGEEYLGYHILSQSELSSQVVRKNDPKDRVGNVVELDGRLRIIEYSDLPDEVGEKLGEDGQLAIWAGSIAVHIFDADLLRRVTDHADGLPFHIAHKKVPHVDAQGQLHKPESPNAVKFERFIFDVLPLAERPILVEIDPAEGFAPLKNASGAPDDTPETTRAALSDWYARRLQHLGHIVPDDAIIEVSPLYALDEADLAERLPVTIAFEKEVRLVED